MTAFQYAHNRKVEMCLKKVSSTNKQLLQININSNKSCVNLPIAKHKLFMNGMFLKLFNWNFLYIILDDGLGSKKKSLLYRFCHHFVDLATAHEKTSDILWIWQNALTKIGTLAYTWEACKTGDAKRLKQVELQSL